MQQFGRYLIEERLGGGGMAEVFRARVVGPGGFAKEVALKRVLPQHAADPDFERMFVDEARLAATLTHANIVQVLDFGKVGETHFLTMEWVDGVDVARLLEFTRAQGRRIPPEVALRIAAEALEGLGYAHAKIVDGRKLGVVHRDISPSNILVSWAGEVRVADFGIAAAAGRTRFTHTGYVRGKPEYMSPEQSRGDALDARSDLFAMGLVLHELLTGHPVFAGSDAASILERVERADVPPPSRVLPDLPPGIDRLVMRALALQPGDRYASAGAFRHAIEEYAAEHRLRVSPAPLASLLASVFGRVATAPRTDTAPEADKTVESRARTPRRAEAEPRRRASAAGAPAIAGGVLVVVAGLAIGLGWPPRTEPAGAIGTPRAEPVVTFSPAATQPGIEAPLVSATAAAQATPRGTRSAKAVPSALEIATPIAKATSPPRSEARVPGDESEFRAQAEMSRSSGDWIGARENYERAAAVRRQNGLPPDPALDDALEGARKKCQELAADALTEARAYESLGNVDGARAAVRLAILHAAPGTRERETAEKMLERIDGVSAPVPSPSPTSSAPELPWMLRDREGRR